jgi:Holliday junction DNA helicase RuvB
MNFRPSSLEELIGQEKIKQALKIAIDASKKTGNSLPHMIFQGPPGLGKSTFGYLIAKEIGSYCTSINASTISSQSVLIKALVQCKNKDIVFIDEIHALPQKFAELLYMPMEDNKLLIQQKDKKTGDERCITVPLASFTLLGATTNTGNLPKPLLDRMSLKFFLDFYSEKELIQIIEKNSKNTKASFSLGAAKEIVKRSRGTPRLANSNMNWVVDYAVANNLTKISSEDAIKAFQIYGIDEEGLDANDLTYLKVLNDQIEPIGLKAIASISGIPESLIEEHIEPHLLKLGKIQKTKRGRILAANNFETEIQELFNAYKNV